MANIVLVVFKESDRCAFVDVKRGEVSSICAVFLEVMVLMERDGRSSC